MGQGYSSEISWGVRGERPGSSQQKHAPEMALEIQSRRKEPLEGGDSSQIWQ